MVVMIPIRVMNDPRRSFLDKVLKWGADAVATRDPDREQPLGLSDLSRLDEPFHDDRTATFVSGREDGLE